MCYSAMVRSDYEKFVREYGAKLSLKNFYDIFYRRLGDKSLLVVTGQISMESNSGASY